MDISEAGRLWDAYKAKPIIKEVHPQDTMWSTGQDWYWSVGESAARVIVNCLAAGPTRRVTRVLDFGCGWGRVARHLHNLFPSAELLFSELNSPASEFCAGTFSGRAVSPDQLPNNIDVIWLGSVFTHIRFEHVRPIFDRLAASLSNGGVLVTTFLGRQAINIHQRAPLIAAAKWRKILANYEASGVGYESYDREDLGDYGVSLTSAARVVSLGASSPELRLICYHEAGWANNQDVAAWARDPLA